VVARPALPLRVRRAQGHPHRRGGRALWRPGQRHAGIENYISVLETDGPKFAAALEPTRAYDVDIMNLQRRKTDPRRRAGWPDRGEAGQRRLAQGKTVILSTGARWRNVNVPGEPSTRTRAWPTARTATARCSRASDVAVIGGGNSGVEAAIDLAGVVAHVT
jgi:alkyl hydroperoxide reductase subunit F